MIHSYNKAFLKPVMAVGVLLAAVAPSAHAADSWTEKWYVNTDLGPVFQQSATFKDEIPRATFKEKATFNTGIRGDLALGYQMTRSLSAEFETGALWNSIDKIGERSLSSTDRTFDHYSIPLLVKGIYRFPLGDSWAPYVGVGLGGVVGISDLSAGEASETSSDFTFAYQAEAGVKYSLTKNTSLGVAYKFFATLDQTATFFRDDITIEGVYTHAVVASFTYKF